ncbi:MAG: hypothetical protein GXO64_01090, partial [Candidatus Micrarchaeota archaeon]|nr:hypothetical protein [Candidatus Micrarchaeota archaeon]
MKRNVYVMVFVFVLSVLLAGTSAGAIPIQDPWGLAPSISCESTFQPSYKHLPGTYDWRGEYYTNAPKVDCGYHYAKAGYPYQCSYCEADGVFDGCDEFVWCKYEPDNNDFYACFGMDHEGDNHDNYFVQHFNAPSAHDANGYTCKLQVYTTMFGQYVREGQTSVPEERAKVYVNGNYVGITTDWACNDPAVNCSDGHTYYDVFKNVNVNEGSNSIKFKFIDGSIAVWRYTFYCTKNHSGPECGNGITEAGEECELPGDNNDDECPNGDTDKCIGNKLSVRDEYGNCGSDCQCEYDDWGSAQCVEGECGATCDEDSDCAPSTCEETYNDYCTGYKLTEYDNDKV